MRTSPLVAMRQVYAAAGVPGELMSWVEAGLLRWPAAACAARDASTLDYSCAGLC